MYYALNFNLANFVLFIESVWRAPSWPILHHFEKRGCVVLLVMFRESAMNTKYTKCQLTFFCWCFNSKREADRFSFWIETTTKNIGSHLLLSIWSLVSSRFNEKNFYVCFVSSVNDQNQNIFVVVAIRKENKPGCLIFFRIATATIILPMKFCISYFAFGF